MIDYASKRPAPARLQRTLFLANTVFAVLILFGWTLVAFVVAEPISWATWVTIGPGAKPEIFTYPYNLLWLLPLAAVGLAWLLVKAGLGRAAVSILLVPVVFHGVTFLSYLFFSRS